MTEWLATTPRTDIRSWRKRRPRPEPDLCPGGRHPGDHHHRRGRHLLPTAVRGILVPALLILSLAKFLMVVGFFMHLEYDHRLFRFMFFAGLVLTWRSISPCSPCSGPARTSFAPFCRPPRAADSPRLSEPSLSASAGGRTRNPRAAAFPRSPSSRWRRRSHWLALERLEHRANDRHRTAGARCRVSLPHQIRREVASDCLN